MHANQKKPEEQNNFHNTCIITFDEILSIVFYNYNNQKQNDNSLSKKNTSSFVFFLKMQSKYFFFKDLPMNHPICTCKLNLRLAFPKKVIV